MRKLCGLSVLGVVVLFGGCATPAPLSEDGYERTAIMYAGSYRCGVQGFIAPDNAALGMQYSRSGLTGWTYDSAKLEQRVQVLKQRSNWPSKEECNELAMTIHTRKQQINVNNQNAKADQDSINQAINNRPTQTYCNKIGSQLLCNSY